MFQNNPSRGSPVHLALALVLVAAVIFFGFKPAQAQAPDNDAWENATAISLDVPVPQSISQATTSPDDPWNCSKDLPGGYTVWYTYTPAAKEVINAQIISADFYTVMGVYTRGGWGFNPVACQGPAGVTFVASENTTYYIMIGASGIVGPGRPYPPPVPGTFTLSLTKPAPPGNDNFAAAETIPAIPYSFVSDNWTATVEQGEPNPTCLPWWANSSYNTVWFAYSPTESHSITAQIPQGFYSNFLAVYSGTALNDLTEVRCQTDIQWNSLKFYAQAGTTYYIQLGSTSEWDRGTYVLDISLTLPPSADFWYWPGDPSVFDMVQFQDNSYDPAYVWFSDYTWDFGGGVTASGNPVEHHFAADGDYTVKHSVLTYDMRTAEVTKVVQVRTYDVGIAKLSVPTSARLGQTRPIVVGLRNTNYPQVVRVELYKSVPGGYQLVGYLQQNVPVRSLNRTTEFSFNYTFTSEDVALGKVTFKAVAILQDCRDALPGDNEATATPTRVSR